MAYSLTIPNRQTDPLDHAKWWMGDDLVKVAQRQADAFRLELHSGMLPGKPTKDVLQQLKHLELRNILHRDRERRGGRIVFAFHPQLRDLFMAEAEQRATAQQGTTP